MTLIVCNLKQNYFYFPFVPLYSYIATKRTQQP